MQNIHNLLYVHISYLKIQCANILFKDTFPYRHWSNLILKALYFVPIRSYPPRPNLSICRPWTVSLPKNSFWKWNLTDGVWDWFLCGASRHSHLNLSQFIHEWVKLYFFFNFFFLNLVYLRKNKIMFDQVTDHNGSRNLRGNALQTVYRYVNNYFNKEGRPRGHRWYNLQSTRSALQS